MIQRIQSIYLFLAAAALVCPIFIPLATASGDAAALASTGANIFADGIYWFKELPGGMSLVFTAAFSAFAIFLYKNRPRQMRLAGGMAILAFLLSLLFAVFGYYCAQQLPEGSSVHLALGSACPLVAITLLLLAYRGIKKDEELVRSSDRLR